MDFDQYYFKLSPINGNVNSNSGGTRNPLHHSFAKKNAKASDFSDKFQKAKEKQKEKNL